MLTPPSLMIALILYGGLFASPAVAETPPGFESMFDGVTLSRWRGDPTIWSAHEGTIRAKTEGERPGNTFLIFDKEYSNFEMRLSYRFVNEGGNSGLQLRSGVVEGTYEVAGLQANIIHHPADCVHPRCVQERFGMLTEEGNRTELVMFGEQASVTRARINGGGFHIIRTVTGQTNPPDEIVKAIKRRGEWNDVVLIAYEGRIVWVFNNVVVIDATDKDPLWPRKGVIALQANADRAIDFRFRDISIKPIDSLPDIANRFVYKLQKFAEPKVKYRSIRFAEVETPSLTGQ